MENKNILKISCDKAREIINALENGEVVHPFSDDAFFNHLQNCSSCCDVYKEASSRIKDTIRREN